jgi:hypothetical protein
MKSPIRLYVLAAVVILLAIVSTASASVFQINYTDAAGTGFYDPTLGPARRQAMQRACDAWSRCLTDNNTIIVEAGFANMGGTYQAATTATGSPTRTFRSFTAQAGVSPTVWYPSALADALADRELKSGYSDIRLTFNADIDGEVLGDRDWHYQSEPPAGDDLDFQTIAMHELAHGLGFYTTFQADGTFGQSEGYPVIYDTLLAGADGGKLVDMSPSAGNVTGEVFFAGSAAADAWANAGGTGPAPVYAPSRFSYSSSLVHWDRYRFEGDLSLMAPYYDTAIRLPDHVTIGALADMGWSVEYPHAPEPSVMLVLAGGMLIALRRTRRLGG